MELLQLRYFYESAKTENFSHTAEKYIVSPSSVSISIKKLETELGCTLFDREGNKLHLNSNGRILQKALMTALPALDQAVEIITHPTAAQYGDIRMLVRSERRNILDYVYQFKQANPQVFFHISHDFNTDDLSPYDFIIDEQTVKYGNFSCRPIIREPIRLAASKDNPLSGRRLLMDDLKHQTFISMCKGSSLNWITVDACKNAGFNPNIVIESDDPHYIQKCIEINMGIAFIPEFSWLGELGENTVFLDVVDFDLTRVTCIYKNQQKGISAAANAFYRGLTDKFSLL